MVHGTLRSSRRARTALVVAVVLAVALCAAAWAWIASRAVPGGARLTRAMVGLRRVATLGDAELARLVPDVTEVVPASTRSALWRALGGTNDEHLVEAMRREAVDGLLVGTRADCAAQRDPRASLRARLCALAHVARLRARAVLPVGALYVRAEPIALDDTHREALGFVARRLLAGARPPRPSAVPEPWRRPRDVEVMVLLREAGSARLWRSARTGSLASGLATAARVARERWQERAQAMGGPLDARLDSLDVEVSLLERDGELGPLTRPDAVEALLDEAHGIGFERGGDWRYVLPAALLGVTARPSARSGAERFERLEREAGVPGGLLGREDVRLYRFVVVPLARSPAPGRDAPDAFDAAHGADRVD
ncbi:MAG: hypothetical protein RMK74_10740 [Myxococcales bacterium]|nr:hypothetical protein [Myxococcales bacterium]